MSKIKILPEHIVRRICAGEVVIRPACVVKELIENSIDAGAKNISVFVEEGGKKLIKVIDDGEGMSKEDLILATNRFATSKIKEVADLYKIGTLGFRGEALYAICSVSVMRIFSKPQEVAFGNSVLIEDAKIKSISPCSIPNGTTVEVRNLFYNTPARLKFLKSDKIENSHILQKFIEYAICYYDIEFSLYINQKQIYNTRLCKDFKERIKLFFGEKIYENLLPLEIKGNEFEIKGYLTHPSAGCGLSRNIIFCFVNKRPVESLIIQKAINQVYAEVCISPKNFFCILFLKILPCFVDVNVHPTKEHVKFQNQDKIYEEVKNAIKERLKEPVRFDLKLSVQSAMEKYFQRVTKTLPKDYKTSLPKQQQIYLKTLPEVKIIGQIYNNFILAEDKEGFLIIDQHAVDERLNFEKLKKDIQNSVSQKLLNPIVIEYFGEDKKGVVYLKKIGFEIEIFGNSILIQALPSFLVDKLKTQHMQQIIKDILERPIGSIDEVLASISCAISVKAGEQLSKDAMSNLVYRFYEYNQPSTCPHHRPTFIRLSKSQINKFFLRG